jgi:TolA-binding protein
VKDKPEALERFGAQWTPTVLVMDAQGNERHRIEGFLPADDFLAQLKLGLAQVAVSAKEFDKAEKIFREIVQELPKTDAAAEALYWAGVSRYKGTNDAAALKGTADAFKKQYSDTSWAKKASIWN